MNTYFPQNLLHKHHFHHRMLICVRVLSLRSGVIHGFVTEPWHSHHVLFSREREHLTIWDVLEISVVLVLFIHYYSIYWYFDLAFIFIFLFYYTFLYFRSLFSFNNNWNDKKTPFYVTDFNSVFNNHASLSTDLPLEVLVRPKRTGDLGRAARWTHMPRWADEVSRMAGILPLWAVVANLAHMRRWGEPPTGTSKSYKENVHKSVETKLSKKKN